MRGLSARVRILVVFVVAALAAATFAAGLGPSSDVRAAPSITEIWDEFQGPSAIAYGTPNNTLYVVNQWGNLSVINGTTNRFVRDLGTFSFPYSGVYDPEADELFVGTGNLPTPTAYGISVVDLKTARTVETIPGAIPWGTVYDPATHAVYVEANGSILKLNAQTNAIVQTVHGFGSFRPQAYDPTRNLLFGVNWTDILAVDMTTGHAVWNLSNPLTGVYPIGYDPLTDDVYLAHQAGQSSDVAVVDGATGKLVATITDVFQPQGYLFDPANGDMYISNAASTWQLVVVNGTANVEVARIGVISAPGAMAYDPVNQAVYVACTYPYVNMTGVILVVPTEAYPLPAPSNASPLEIVAILAALSGITIALVVVLEHLRDRRDRRKTPPG